VVLLLASKYCSHSVTEADERERERERERGVSVASDCMSR